MIELPFIFLGGLLGSAHCVGMCGGFALTIGLGAPGFASNLARQLAYTLGRVLTYSFFGVVAGYAGLWLSHKAGTLVNVQAVLSMLAGGRASLSGSAGPRPGALEAWLRAGGGVSCLAGGFVGPFLRARGSLNALDRGNAHGVPSLRACLRFPGHGQQYGQRRAWALDHGGFRGRHRADHDPDRRGGLVDLAGGTSATAANRGHLRYDRRTDLAGSRGHVSSVFRGRPASFLSVLRAHGGVKPLRLFSP